MSKPKLEVVARPVEQPFRTPPDDNGLVDVSFRKLTLKSQLQRGGIDVDITNALTDMGGGQNNVVDSMTAAPTLVVNVLDRDYKALNSGVFAGIVDVDVDGVPFRLVNVELVDVEILQLTFYHKIVALLLKQKKPLSASRASMTRAQFVELMLREILPDFPDLIFVCPEERKLQPVGGSKKSGRSLTAKSLGSTATAASVNPRGTGFGVSSLDIRDWDGSTVTLGPDQMHNAQLVLDTCVQLNAPAKAVLAVVEACIVEPDKPFGNPPQEAGSGGSAGILQWGGGGTTLPSWATDVVQSVTHSLQDPGATGKGGMISLSRRYPEHTAGWIAQREQGSAFGARYDMAQSGAQTVINAYTGAGAGFTAAGATGISTTSATTSTYNFTRGQSGQTEDSYTCGLRLASEVNWRFFISGRRSVFFVTDDDLIALPSRYEFSPGNVGLGQVTFTTELGGRMVMEHGKKIPKPSEGQVAVRIGRWEAQIGDPITLSGYGVGDDKYVLTEVDRDLFDKTGTVYFKAPQKPGAEPAPETTTTTSVSGSTGQTFSGTGAGAQSSNPIDRVYAAAAAMSERNYPYIAGSVPQGDHGGTWAQAIAAQGHDCSGSCSIVLYQAGLMNGFSGPIVSGDFDRWGVPGRGSQMTVYYNAGHVFIVFYGRPMQRFDTVGPTRGPHLRTGAPPEPDALSMSLRHWPNY